MSTSRRRPAPVGTRRPQVAGRPRGTATSGPGTEPDEVAEGGLAVEERTEERAGERTGSDRPHGGTVPDAPSRGPRARTVPRTGDRPDGSDGGTGAVDGTGTDVDADVDTADGTAAESALPSAPAVRSGEAEPAAGKAGSGLAGRARRIPLPAAPTSTRATAAFLAVTVLLTAAAVFFAISWGRLEFGGATSNTALTDVGTTAAVSEQIGEATTKVYSFDFARLDQAEADARAGITGAFNGQFDQIFGNVRQLAPKQQAVVTATIPKSAVASIEGDHATVYVFVNQVIRRVDDAGKPQTGGAAARLRVDAQYVDGRWKIAGMSPA